MRGAGAGEDDAIGRFGTGWLCFCWQRRTHLGDSSAPRQAAEAGGQARVCGKSGVRQTGPAADGHLWQLVLLRQHSFRQGEEKERIQSSSHREGIVTERSASAGLCARRYREEAEVRVRRRGTASSDSGRAKGILQGARGGRESGVAAGVATELAGGLGRITQVATTLRTGRTERGRRLLIDGRAWEGKQTVLVPIHQGCGMNAPLGSESGSASSGHTLHDGLQPGRRRLSQQ